MRATCLFSHGRDDLCYDASDALLNPGCWIHPFGDKIEVYPSETPVMGQVPSCCSKLERADAQIMALMLKCILNVFKK